MTLYIRSSTREFVTVDKEGSCNEKFAKFWKAANFRLKFGLIVTLIFFIIGFVVYYVPHVNPFTFNTYPNKLGASAEHWLGTTSMGQDVVWLLIEAIHNSLVIGLIVAFLGTVVGVLSVCFPVLPVAF